MKARETALRLKRFEADEKARKAADLEHMIREFETIASDLDRQIQAEEDRSGIRDVNHFAYSTFAKSAAQRRDNLRASVAGLREKLDAAVKERDLAAEQALQPLAAPMRTSDRLHMRRAERGATYVPR
jgi:flagellar FliJ protein